MHHMYVHYQFISDVRAHLQAEVKYITHTGEKNSVLYQQQKHLKGAESPGQHMSSSVGKRVFNVMK